MDTAIPGLLGAWQDFRGRYIAPILSASDDEVLNVKVEVGKELRARVGDYMLRRTKAEKLKGLPEKRIFTADASSEGEQYLDKLARSEEHTSELQSRPHLVCRLLLEKKKK